MPTLAYDGVSCSFAFYEHGNTCGAGTFFSRNDMWMYRHGKEMLTALQKIVTQPEPPNNSSYVGIVGHAIFITNLAGLMFPQHIDIIHEVIMSEADALVVDENGVQHHSENGVIVLT
jgi:hypothetical protein